MAPSKNSKLVWYLNDLKRKVNRFPCPYCKSSSTTVAASSSSPPPQLSLLQAEKFERHCLEFHGMNPRLSCVWCCGKEKWNAGEKYLHGEHLRDCFRKFISSENDAALDDATLNRYYNDLKSRKHPFPCPTCFKSILPRDFERHCSVNHGLNPKLSCVWCFGNESWTAGSKNRRVDHLNLCFRKFYTLNANPVSEDAKPRLMDMTPMCEPRDFFGKEDLSGTLPPEAFEEFRVLDHGNRVSYFRDENLNDAASYMRMYEQTKKTHDWIHVMVKTVTFKSFLEVIEQDDDYYCYSGEGRVELLPFSCWCDGGNRKREAKFRQHRHMLVVSSPKGRFAKEVWKRVIPSEKPKKDDGKKFLSKAMNIVESRMHLANTIGYLCKRESRCNFKIDGKRGPVRLKHFYVTRTLPKDYMLALCVQWDGGIMELLYQEKLQNVSVPLLAKSDGLFYEQSRWKQKVKDFYGLKRGLVLPLSKGYLPVEGFSAEGDDDDDDDIWEFGLEYCWLTNGKKLYFEFSEENENLDDETWLGLQVEGGNCFYEAVQEETWIPRRRDQEKLNLAMPLLRENCEMRAANEGLRDEVTLSSREKGELRSQNASLREENVQLKEENVGLKDENVKLKVENVGLKEKHEGEMSNLKEKHRLELNGLGLELKRKHEGEVFEMKEKYKHKLKKLRSEIKSMDEKIKIINITNNVPNNN